MPRTKATTTTKVTKVVKGMQKMVRPKATPTQVKKVKKAKAAEEAARSVSSPRKDFPRKDSGQAGQAPVATIPSAEKQEVISQFQVKAGDTGSPEVQVALLTKRIEKLVGHLKANPSDNHSRRGLLGIVSKRRRLLNYLEKRDVKRYKEVSQRLGLGK